MKHVDPIVIYLLYFRAKFIVVVVYVLCCYALNVVTRGDVKMFVHLLVIPITSCLT